MELTEDKIIEEIENRSEKINKFGVKEIGLFGSYRKREYQEESDIDILVQFKEGEKTFDNYMGLKFFLEDLFDKEVDLVIKEALKDHLKDEILRSTNYAARV
ncbi:MAG: nucleotidyltransferase family protein [Candidatus Thermoplasmatota archaeon]|nr:nucleotidyltransferase family protein [Candidatus Thermoplasmatota archaeon]